MYAAFIFNVLPCRTPTLRTLRRNTFCDQTLRNRFRLQNCAQVRPHASFTDDFFQGPTSPPKPRPLYQVVLFSVTTNLIWYPYYKYCIEEELRRETGDGFGGFAALLPFVTGLTSPFVLSRDPAILTVAVSLAWAAALQYWLYRRVNGLVEQKFNFKPLHPWWFFVPGFNLIVGFRAYHFLSLVWGADPDGDPLTSWFPFLNVNQLSISGFLTTPSLWLKLR